MIPIHGTVNANPVAKNALQMLRGNERTIIIMVER
jgi:hypothetical protein